MSSLPPSTAQIYNAAAEQWRRTAPVLLSDYTARPFLLNWAGSLQESSVLDLGCGEGYVARQLVERGARKLFGVDVSAEMIERARQAGDADGRLRYEVGSAMQTWVEPGSIDLGMAVFLFNYLTVDEMQVVMKQVFTALRPGGRFVFSVPHPALAFSRPHTEPFYFDAGNHGYFSGKDALFEGKIWRRDGVAVPVRCVHKTWSDYFRALAAAGFVEMPEVEELHVQEEHIALDPAFFGPLRDVPLHVAMRIHRPL
jgi:SAM-dependent methyltransferase